MGVGDPILVGNSNVGDVGFGDATIISADPRSALDCVLYVEPMDHRDGNGIVGRSWGATASGGWAVQAAGDLVWSDGLFACGRTAIQAQGNRFGAIVAAAEAVTANGFGRSPRGRAWCAVIGLLFVSFRDGASIPCARPIARKER